MNKQKIGEAHDESREDGIGESKVYLAAHKTGDTYIEKNRRHDEHEVL